MGLACCARAVKRTFERKMAEKHLKSGPDGVGSIVTADDKNMTPDSGEGHPETGMQRHNTEGPPGPAASPTARRKSLRRATITRRSLPALSNPYQVLCRGISTSLSQEERLEKLMEASMKLALERTQNSLQPATKNSLESFQNQVEHIKKEWGCLAKSIRSEHLGHQLAAPAASSSDPTMQRAIDKGHEAINRLKVEIESWEALLNKHRRKAEELERKVEQGQDKGVSLDSTSLAQSSQFDFIQRKPNYHSLLCRQQPKLHTMAMIMNTQCKIVQELLSIKELSRVLVKETSGRLAAEAGFQDISPDPVRKLITAPISSATT